MLRLLLQLLSEGELAPGLLATEFAQRRQMLAEALPPQCLALLPSAPTMYTSPGGRIPYSYRQVSTSRQQKNSYVLCLPCYAQSESH